ncbi:MAG: Fic family protein [Bacilli bacterium]|nr:Fic family protein [Bacilli bacterium]
MHKLPIKFNYEDPEILKALVNAKYELGNLNGLINLLPNPKIILNAIILGEAKESSSIENIVTTFDEIFREITLKNQDANTKEVVNYRQAILKGYSDLKEKGFISTNMIVNIHSIIEPNVGGIRKIPGTVIMNTKTKEILHTPPQSEKEILEYMNNLEKYINYPEMHEIDPILKMAMIHYQFESIHPFHDGNGRTGRVLNILYLILKKQIDLPILYLSKYINKTKSEYYKHLSGIRKDDKNIKDYLLYMIKGVEETSNFTISFINNFLTLMKEATEKIKEKCPSIYSEKLMNYLFYDFYTKNEYFRDVLGISRNTASKYLNLLVDKGFLIEEQVGKEKLYKNVYLYSLIDKW